MRDSCLTIATPEDAAADALAAMLVRQAFLDLYGVDVDAPDGVEVEP